ncbi:alpha/beta fold hydrolase [Candidatus Viridilinea mediisalina]|uniref:AB hydrolase-1 domain-containing protein n=1 Tax=Candidatus Viridilinea mediisalina TaxID=2024553 RepID=A0A2A6RI88_9CHLR|nr:alpha/beta fold hydrolase [Candidatus Viridilinea mediisalina]PDW02844.1 hypothetical protein CJ255_11905 [Candidatus Viridilinea mediisalina]
METPAWLDRQAYPFTSRFIEVEAGRMHYVDEGEGPVLLFVHGTPVWSFVYRNMIKALAPTYRCIAPDHLGFGLSDKPAAWSYRPADHARNLQHFIERLGLRDITLVVHDFGGPIGLAYAIEQPDNVIRLALLNTWMWSLQTNQQALQINQILSGKFGQFLYTRLNFSPRFLIPMLAGQQKLSSHIHRHYINAAPTPQARHAMWVCARELIGSSDWYEALWAKREQISKHPALLLWGMADRGVSGGIFDLTRWQQILPHARTVTYQGVGHFVQEEASNQVVTELRTLLEG